MYSTLPAKYYTTRKIYTPHTEYTHKTHKHTSLKGVHQKNPKPKKNFVCEGETDMASVLTENVIVNEFGKGWTSELISATGAETKSVKATRGKVAYLKVNGAYDVTMKDGGATGTSKWAVVNNTAIDLSGCPIEFATSIDLTFGGAGSAWVIYK